MLLSLVQIRADVLKAQKIINRGLYWSYGFKSRNSSVSLYDINRELRIPPLSAFCAISQLRCIRKWKNSSCIINHLTNIIIFLLCHITHRLKNQGLWIRN